MHTKALNQISFLNTKRAIEVLIQEPFLYLIYKCVIEQQFLQHHLSIRLFL